MMTSLTHELHNSWLSMWIRSVVEWIVLNGFILFILFLHSVGDIEYHTLSIFI